MIESLERELIEHSALTDQYKDDIRQLEDKLAKAQELGIPTMDEEELLKIIGR